MDSLLIEMRWRIELSVIKDHSRAILNKYDSRVTTDETRNMVEVFM